MEIAIALLAAGLIYILQQFLFKKFWAKKLSIDLNFSTTHCVEGEDAYILQTVINQKLLPLPVLRLRFQTSKHLIFYDNKGAYVSDNCYRDDLVSLIMYQKLTRKLIFQCSRRGYYLINKCSAIWSNLFLNDSLVADIPLALSLYVLPKYIDTVKITPTFNKIIGDVLTRRFINEDPFEFAGIRQYQIYDTLKSINWNASAKTGELKVNVHDSTASQEVKILLNIDSETLWIYDDLLEESIRLAASLANLLIRQGIPTGVYSNGCDIITKEPLRISPGSGTSHITSICEGLARLDTSNTSEPFASFAEPLVKYQSSKDYTVIISFYQKDDLQNLLKTAFSKKKDCYHWIIPTDKNSPVNVDPCFNPVSTAWRLKE